MKTARCPSCGISKRSAATSRDGLCDECAGRGRWKPVERRETRQKGGTTYASGENAGALSHRFSQPGDGVDSPATLAVDSSPGARQESRLGIPPGLVEKALALGLSVERRDWKTGPVATARLYRFTDPRRGYDSRWLSLGNAHRFLDDLSREKETGP